MSKAVDLAMAIVAIVFMAGSAIGLFNSNLDSRVQFLIALGASGLVLADIAVRHLLAKPASE
ncbi:hypothetical protein [Niveibacterium terrae]|uniref:hypothetical protein n=1 Tax=Niveibacterium terrae TaxID=3373598 RepID=UPI003A94102C